MTDDYPIPDMDDTEDELRAEIARLRAALEWYGNPDSWKPSTGPGPIPVATDLGNRAREALANKD